MKVTKLSGFPEYLPAERIVEQHFLDVIRETFELHGFTSLETRAVEPVERLLAAEDDAVRDGRSREQGIEAVRPIRDEIRARVLALLDELGVAPVDLTLT